MKDESQPLGPVEGSSPAPLEKLDKAQRNRLAAAQLIAAAEKIEAQEAKERKEHAVRDFRIVGAAVMKLAQKDLTLARTVLEGMRAATISVHDRKHLARDDGALAQLQRIVEGQPPLSSLEQHDPAKVDADGEAPARAPDTAWFAVPFSEKNKVPAGVRYDPESKLRFAPTRVLVEEMRGLEFEERTDLADRDFPERG